MGDQPARAMDTLSRDLRHLGKCPHCGCNNLYEEIITGDKVCLQCGYRETVRR